MWTAAEKRLVSAPSEIQRVLEYSWQLEHLRAPDAKLPTAEQVVRECCRRRELKVEEEKGKEGERGKGRGGERKRERKS